MIDLLWNFFLFPKFPPQYIRNTTTTYSVMQKSKYLLQDILQSQIVCHALLTIWKSNNYRQSSSSSHWVCLSVYLKFCFIIITVRIWIFVGVFLGVCTSIYVYCRQFQFMTLEIYTLYYKHISLYDEKLSFFSSFLWYIASKFIA